MNARFPDGASVRLACRTGEWNKPTAGLAQGFAQANLVILPKQYAFDFLLFCQRNPKPCPILEVTAPGDPSPREIAPQADLRTDLPKYRVFRNGQLVGEPTNLFDCWQEDFVSFLIGCSFTFEAALLRAGVPVRHIETGRNVPMYRTNIPCHPSGVFQGNMVVSMRPLTPAGAIQATLITSRYPRVHGAPVHLGFPDQIGIKNLAEPDFGDPVPVHEDEIPVFWACGVTPQIAIMNARLPLVITHSPGCMFVSDRTDESYSDVRQLFEP